MKKLFLFSAGLLGSAMVLGIGPSELEPTLEQALSKDCILDEKQIIIPQYPKAYNPSLIPYKEGYLLSFRVRKSFPKEQKEVKPRDDASYLGLVELDKNFAASKKSVQLLDIQSYSMEISSTAEDARLLKVGESIYIFFNDVNLNQERGSFAVYFGELIKNGSKFALKEPAKFLYYPKSVFVEKNWSPFVYEDKIYVIYSDQPRLILEVDPTTGYCTEVTTAMASDWEWNWGIVRGGTPAYLIENRFLTFFHSVMPAKSSNGKSTHVLNYVVGAYTFDKVPPFSIRAVSNVPLGALEDYLENNARKVVFPCGLVVEDDRLHVTWGKNDRRIWITTFDKRCLLDSLQERP